MSDLGSPLDRALTFVAEIFFDPRFEAAKATQMTDVPDDVAQSPEDATRWCADLRGAWQDTGFQKLIGQIVETGQQHLQQRSAEEAVPEALKENPDAAQAMQRFGELCLRMRGEDAYAQWLAMALIGCYRVCAVNAAQAFSAEQWNEIAVRWMQAEAYFRAGRGGELGAVLPELNRLTGERLPTLVGERIVFGLAELSVYLPDVSLLAGESAQH